jgi:muramoyltetrapeptide carboxypeptidase
MREIKHIAIAAPGRKVIPEQVEYAVKWLHSKGMNAVFDERLFASDYIFAGTAELRAQVIQEYLDRDDIDAIWFARGGYGSIHIIDKIDFSHFVQHPKPLIGISDTTVFHGKVQSLGLTSIHASMPFYLEKKTPESLQSIYDALLGNPLHYEWNAHPCNRQGEAQGVLVGGNLSVLYGMMGSNSFPDTDNRILFLEEIDEYIYHVERMMLGLKRAGKLKNLKALMIGGLTSIHDNPNPFGKTVEQAIFDTVREYDYPVCFNTPAGHIDDNRAMVLGCQTTLSVSNNTTIFNQKIIK